MALNSLVCAEFISVDSTKKNIYGSLALVLVGFIAVGNKTGALKLRYPSCQRFSVLPINLQILKLVLIRLQLSPGIGRGPIRHNTLTNYVSSS